MLDRLRQFAADRRHERLLAAVTLDTARQRAATGAAFLDRADDGWADRIDPATLRLSDGGSCVLGQLHGEFRLGLFRARVFDGSSAPVASLSPVDLGFHTPQGLPDEATALDYAFLTRAWREEILRRRMGSEVADGRSRRGGRVLRLRQTG